MNKKNKNENNYVVSHSIDPVYDSNSEILVLGSFPSVKSRQQKFFYGHPQNRFWKVLAAVMEEDVPETIEDKKEFLIRNRIAVWDVIDSCIIDGSSDSSIKNVVPSDLEKIILNTKIKHIFANGATARKLYEKHHEKKLGIKIEALPSTSPANAAYSLESLINEWSSLKKFLIK